MANKVTVIPQKDLSKHLSKDDVVQAKLRNHANEIKLLAEVILGIHRKTGSHKIVMEGHKSRVKYGHIDWYVALEGPAAVSVEYGHRTKSGKWVQGLYIITKAGYSTRT